MKTKSKGWRIDALGLCMLAIDARKKEGTTAHAEAKKMLEDATILWREQIHEKTHCKECGHQIR